MLKTDVSSISPMLVATLMICFSAMGCTLINLKKDVHRSLESTVIVGRINAEVPGKGPIIVAACPIHEPKTIAHYTVLHESGEYELMLNQGDYYVFAYRDKNSNLIYEAGEPAGQYGAPNRVRAPAVGVVFDIDFAIPEIGGPIVINHGTRITPVLPRILHSRQAGDITNLDDERFDEENGAKGFWEPIAFFKKFGGNVYFLEEYDLREILNADLQSDRSLHAAGGADGFSALEDHAAAIGAAHAETTLVHAGKHRVAVGMIDPFLETGITIDKPHDCRARICDHDVVRRLAGAAACDQSRNHDDHGRGHD